MNTPNAIDCTGYTDCTALEKALYPYQWDWLNDRAQFKIGLWARQTGKDYTCAAEAVIDCLNRPRNHWLIIACGERQAIESLQHAKHWAQQLHTGYTASSTEIRFSNGSRITALPAKPETIRGYSANLILTEFAFHDHPDQIWRALFPILTNPLKAGPKKLRIISTPNGHSNKFHSLWTNDDPTFTKHKITIHDAVAAGLPIDIPLLQRGLADSEAFTQEYQCEFLDQSSVLLPYDLIQSCESPEAFESSTLAILSTYPGEMYLGIDFGRKHDLTVAWTLERISRPVGNEVTNFISNSSRNEIENFNASAPHNLPSSILNLPTHVFITREILILSKSPTPEQIEALTPRIHRARRVCLDYTGPGIGLGDLLVSQFGEYLPGPTPASSPARSGRIELCTFTPGLKHELFSHLRSAFERRIITIPASPAIREDLHSIQRVVSANGQLSYRASHTADGHSDRCTALALALRAAESAPPVAAASSIGSRYHSSRHR